MSFDISKIDTQDVVNAIKMLRISTNVVNKYMKCTDTFYAITNSVTYWYKYSAIKQIEYMFK